MLHLNIVRSSENIQGMNWDKIVDKQNDQEAYNAFHAIITEGVIFASLPKKVLNCLKLIIQCDNYIICIAIQSGCVKNKQYLNIQHKSSMNKSYNV